MVGNWRPTQSAAAGASMASSIDASSAGVGGDWRSQLQPEAREWIVNKIMETLMRHLPTSVLEGINELREIAIWCEEKIYTDATTQSDYLRKISLKMLSMETKNPPAAPINPGMPNPAAMNQNPTDPGSIVMQSQPNNPGQPLPVPNRQSILLQNLQNNTSDAVQGSSSMAHTLPPILGLGQSNISGVTHAANLRNMSGISQSSVNNSLAQGAQPNIYANSQRQLPGSQQQQQIISHQQQQQQSQNPLLYQQQQLQQQLLNRKLQHSSLFQLPPPPPQQSLLQPKQMQSTQVYLMQMSSSLQQNQSNIQQTQPASTQTVSQPGLQQNQLNQIQLSAPSLLQNPSISRQQQAQSLHQQASSAQQQSTPIPQQSILSHQQQMIGLQGNMSNMQQNQLLGQQNNMADIQQQQQRLPIQQNNLLSMQHQQLMNQQTLNLQQQQLGSHSNMSGLQHQQHLLGSLPSVSNMQPHQLALTKQKNAAQQQQQHQQQQQQQQQQSSFLLHSQGPQSQNPSSQQQLMSQHQSQPSQLQQQLLMQQQSNSLQREMQQRLQNSGPILQTQNAMEQKPFLQAPTSSVESTAQTGHAGAIDWQEECYQKVKSLKELHFAELTEFHQKITLRLQQQEAFIPPGKQSEQHEKLKGFRQMLERMLALLQINKNNIPVGLKEKFPLYEKQILSMVASNRAKKTSPQVQGQQQFQHPNAGKAQIIPQQQQSQSMEVSEPAPFQVVQEEPTFGCPICMCALVSPFTTVCGHIFCEGCIKAATEKQKKCPTCRSKLTGRNNIHRVFLPTSD